MLLQHADLKPEEVEAVLSSFPDASHLAEQTDESAAATEASMNGQDAPETHRDRVREALDGASVDATSESQDESKYPGNSDCQLLAMMLELVNLGNKD